LIELWSPNVTLEGDAMVMYQQTGKSIFKLLKKVYRGDQIFGTFAYLQDIKNFEKELVISEVYEIESLLNVIKIAALYQIKRVDEILKSDTTNAWSANWNKKYQIEIVKAVKLHTIYTTASIFAHELKSATVSPSLKDKLLILCKIYCCDQILKHCDGPLLIGMIDSCQLMMIKDKYEELADEITPHMKLLTQASSPSDETLHSLMGRNLKDCYSNLFEAASNSRLNQEKSLEAIDVDVRRLSSKLTLAAKI
jgi:hypothetical protein